MTKHLPECERWYVNMPEPDECPACEMFRACEQRVLTDVDAEAMRQNMAFQRGVSAARDAVAAAFTDDHKDDWGVRCLYDYEALDAIDALRLDTADCLCPTPNPDCQHPTCPREKK